MLNRKCMVIGFLAFCLTATLFIGMTTGGKQNSTSAATDLSTTSLTDYDPWYDLNHDGWINIVDIVALALKFDTSGTPIPLEGNISVPAAAFVPRNNTADWRNDGNRLFNYEASGYAYFFASVQLPHGATVTNLTIYWYDGGAEMVACLLYRYNQTFTLLMALTSSTGNPGMGSSYDDTISYATVDNNKYAYYLEVEVGPSATHIDYQFLYAMIEYEY